MARLALAALLVIAVASAVPAQFDHLHCYKIKTNTTKASYSADLTHSDGAFPAAAGCRVKVPAKLLCVDTQKSNVMPAPPGAAAGASTHKFLCYKVKCPKIAPTVTLQDQFGTHSILVKGSSLLCAPVPVPCTDADGDGSCVEAGDCDDGNPSINPSATEVCNNADDDCDGLTDESDPQIGAACITGQPGACSLGTTACQSGALVCPPNLSPTAEVCDGQDNDCNGTVDDLGTITCGTGACQNSVQACIAGVPQSCTPNLPSAEVCDGTDNNCNGTTDEFPASSSCTPAAPRCAGGTCSSCLTSSDCTSFGFGGACSGGSCVCGTSAECTHPRVNQCTASTCVCGVTGGPCPVGQTCNAGVCS